MVTRPEIRSYDYVNHPYAKVRAVLVQDPVRIFSVATQAAAARARSVATALHVSVGGLDIGAEVAVTVGTIEEVESAGYSSTITRIPISWQHASRPEMFPLMDGELSVYALTSTETQLDFLGQYQPPFGVLGGTLNAVAGHRLAEASVDRFIRDVAEHLRKNL